MSESVSYYMGDEEGGYAVFTRKCPLCGRFVKADEEVTLKGGTPVGPNATCALDGKVQMGFEGYY